MTTAPEIAAQTTRIFIRIDRRLVDEDLMDVGEAEALAYNRGLEDAARLALEEGDPLLAALIRRQRQ